MILTVSTGDPSAGKSADRYSIDVIGGSMGVEYLLEVLHDLD